MAKPNRALKPQNKSASKLAGNLSATKQSEAEKLRKIREANYQRGLRMATRAQARADGLRAGFQAAAKGKRK